MQREIVFIQRSRLYRLNELAAVCSILDVQARYLGDKIGLVKREIDPFFLQREDRKFVGVDFLVESQVCVLVPEGAPYQLTDLDDFLSRSHAMATRRQV